MYVRKKKLPKQHLYEKRAHLTFMKLTPGVDFTSILPAAFTHEDPKIEKRH